jgi:hypothetical protein
MAVYEGARPRTILLPRRGRLVESPALPRRRMRAAVRARRRSNRLAFILGGIVLAFMLAFFSLAQSVRVAATGYDIGRLTTQRQDLLVRRQELLSDLHRLGQSPAVRKLAIDKGLIQLPPPIVLTAP